MFAEVNGNSVKLWGNLWPNDAQSIVRSLESMYAKHDKIDVHLHGPGGSVFDGNLIYNSLVGSGIHVTTVNDGLCASMLSVILLAGDEIKMAENAMVMIHAPAGSITGTASQMEKTAKALRSLQKNFVKKYAAKTGRKESEVEPWMQDDNWFDAEEAKEEGFVTDIIDPQMEDIGINALADYNMVATLHNFQAYDTVPAETPGYNQVNKSNENTMKITAQNMVFLAAMGLTISDKSTDAEVNAAFAQLITAKTDADKKAEVAEGKLKTFEDAAEASLKTKRDTLIADGKKAGKITKENEQDITDLAEANYELAEKHIASLEGKKDITASVTEGGKTVAGQDTSKWTFTDWRKKDPAGLKNMKEEDLDQWTALYNGPR